MMLFCYLPVLAASLEAHGEHLGNFEPQRAHNTNTNGEGKILGLKRSKLEHAVDTGGLRREREGNENVCVCVWTRV